ncbi:translation initiation factor eIF-2A [Coemansia reversa NRRL 1564]|uniref:Eukaryotic translation initiation factor 2A n=1 Tax=Coemansia reversa (strain ATCC 12441 / NRRL 1564) TaxID=763665 RepID=A0A2G5B1M4_COERN|nr:translation initiation factor eIF-2A [Coemansia reversa NRRL 1564]|eukprot:PIA12896.1 translation initiation factor eIF-2A [Coemansia reversa NRRL 1564]
MTAREPTQFAYRALREMGVCSGPPESTALKLADKPATEVKALKYSSNGSYLAWAVADVVHIVDAHTLRSVVTIDRPGVVDVRFSPKGTYLVTWERYTKQDDPEAAQNLRVWDTATGVFQGGFVRKSFSAQALQWTEDEKHCAMLYAGEVRFYVPTALDRAAHVLKVDGISSFSVSPGLAPAVAVFVPERGSRPGLVRMYPVGSFARAVANKTFFKADKVEFYWHALGTSLLVLTQTDVDNTGRSYYGESSLYFMAAAGNFDCRVVLDREGPIHDVAWSPSEKEFAVVYGYMPAKTALFNHRAEPVFDFGTAPRNFVRFNPHGRVLAIAGFGNLSGQVDLWDRRTLKKLCTLDAHGASLCEWAPDGRYLLAATLSPRLRVDNAIRIWHYSGALVYHKPCNELYHVDWRPASVSLFPQRAALSPVPTGITIADPVAASATPASTKPATAYRPPHARTRAAADSGSSSPRSLSDMAERRVFGAVSAGRAVPGAPSRVPVGATNEMLARTGEKKRVRARKAPKDEAAAVVPAASISPPSPALSAAPKSAPDTEVEVLKRIRMLKKKIGQIDQLAARRDAGETLELNQLAKIESRSQVDDEIAELAARLSTFAT